MFNIKNQQFTLGQPKWKQGSVKSEDDERTQRRRYMATGSRITDCSDGRTDGLFAVCRCLSICSSNLELGFVSGFLPSGWGNPNCLFPGS